MTKTAQNTRKTPRGKPFQKGGDPRINVGGRPKSHQSLTYWLNEFGNTSPVELADQFSVYSKQLRAGGTLPFFALIAARILMELANEPTVPLLALLFERLEGKLNQPIDISWREKFNDPDKVFKAITTVVEAQLSAPDAALQEAESTNVPQSPDQ